MALSKTQATHVLGDRSNHKQQIFGIPAGPSGEDPGLLCLEGVDSTGATYNRLYLWADSSGNVRYSASIPTDEDSSGSALASSAATGANYTLSNLSSACAVNVNLLPSATATRSLGSSTLYWDNAYLTTLYLTSAFHVTATTSTATVTGNITLADGDIVITEGKLTIDSTVDETSYIKRNQATTTGPLFELECTATSDDYPALLVDFNGTGAIDAMQITTDAAGGAGLRITTANAAGNGLAVVGPASTTASLVLVDGTTGSWLGATGVGMLHLRADGTLAHANASLLNITHTGAVASGALGSSLRIVDSATAAGTDYAVYMTSSTNNILRLATTSATTKTPLTIAGTASTSVALFNLDATSWVGASTVGCLTLSGDGVLAAGANLLRVTSSAANTAASYLVEINATGNFTNSTNGTCLRIIDSGTAAGTSYAAYIASTNNTALHAYAGAVGSTAALFSQIQAGTASIVKIDATTGTGFVGATNVGALHITGDGTLAHANASMVYIANSGATSAAACLGSSLRINDSSGASTGGYVAYITSTNNALLGLQGVAVAKNAIYIGGPASQTASLINISSASVNATNIGTIHVANTGVLAHANATNLYISQAGNIANATLGACARFVDTSAAATTSAAVQIVSTNNRALVCTTGQADFPSGMSTMVSTAACAASAPTATELVTAFGLANTHTTGFVGVLDTSDTKCFLVFTNATDYFYTAALTKAT